MGYTHYFSFKTVKGKADELEKRYQRAIRDCQRITKAFYAKHGRISGYSAHTPLGKYGGLQVNGKGIEQCETFELREHFRQNLVDFNGFCKTNGLPYDTVVTACLAVLKHRLGDAIDVRSDGTRNDWEYGVKLARQVTGLKLKNPIVCLE